MRVKNTPILVMALLTFLLSFDCIVPTLQDDLELNQRPYTAIQNFPIPLPVLSLLRLTTRYDREIAFFVDFALFSLIL